MLLREDLAITNCTQNSTKEISVAISVRSDDPDREQGVEVYSMITSNTFYPFGGKVATIETPSFLCMVSTAKEGFFQKQSMRISDCTNGMPNRRVIAKLLYNSVLSKQDRLGLHDALIASIDELGMNGHSLKDALRSLFEGLKKEGIGCGIIED